MCLYVSVYITVLGSSVRTVWTGKWFLPSVLPDVFLHVVLPRGDVGAAGTLMHLPCRIIPFISLVSPLTLAVSFRRLLKMHLVF